jgi:hypothetical protein
VQLQVVLLYWDKLLARQAGMKRRCDSTMRTLYRARRPNKVPFRQMRYVEIEHDNLESEILNFCLWCSSTAIPRFFDDNLQPRRESDDGTTKVLVTSTLSKYTGKILIAYRLHCLFSTTIQFPMNLLYRQLRMIQAK